MRFAYTILYVADVPATLDHYSSAFGIPTRFLHDSRLYGELETGDTTLAFSAFDMAEANDVAMRPGNPKEASGPVNVTFTTDDVEKAVATATANGATIVMPPTKKPWGQTCSYLRDMNGHLVEIATPLAPREA